MLLYLLRHTHKMVSRRKKTVLMVLLLCTVLYGAVQIMHYQEEYSPLQVLATAENEAQRLLKFLTSYHYQCNSSLHSTNISDWALCTEQDIGINPDPNVPKLAYSIGWVHESFECRLQWALLEKWSLVLLNVHICCEWIFFFFYKIERGVPLYLSPLASSYC